ncbi:MAG TPA: AI-2E family transporter [Burkholderiales bacterium]
MSSASRLSLALTALALIASVAALYFGRAFFVPLLIGILASYTLAPIVDAMQWLRVPRAVGAAVLLAALAGATSWMAYSMGDEATLMIEKLPDAARKVHQKLTAPGGGAPTALQNVQAAANELQGVATKPGARVPPDASQAPSRLREYALAQSALLISVLAQAPIVLLLAYFLLASGDHFRRKLLQLVGPSLERKKDALGILDEIDVQVQRYLLAVLASNALVGLSTWLALEAIGMENAGVWGVIAGILHFIPYLGPLLTAVAAGVAAFVQFGTVVHGLGVAALLMALAFAIGLGFMTWLQGRFARVNAAVLFIALLFFGWLWGVAGLLLGGPLVAIAKVICDRIEFLKPAGKLLGK